MRVMTYEEYILLLHKLNKPDVFSPQYDSRGMCVYKRNGRMIEKRKDMDLLLELEKNGVAVGIITLELLPFHAFKIVKRDDGTVYVRTSEELEELAKTQSQPAT